MLLQPVGEHLAILFVGIYEAHVTGMAEQMPLAVRNVFINRGSNNWGADVLRTTTDQCGQGYLAQLVCVFKVLQTEFSSMLVT